MADKPCSNFTVVHRFCL